MTLAPVSNHSIAPSFNRYITTLPQDLAKSEERKALLYNVVSKICLVAFLAIFAVASAISFGILPLASPLLACLSLVASACLAYVGFQYGAFRSINWQSKAIEDRGQAEELQKIQGWGQERIQAFLLAHRISPSQPLLKRLNEKEPLKALLPAIARYFYWSKIASQHLEEHIKNFHNDVRDPLLRDQGGMIGWQILEEKALPEALKAALMLQIISAPTIQKGVNQIGSLQIKSLDRRALESARDGTDHYFIFHDSTRPPLSVTDLQELLAAQNFDEIRAKLFDPIKGTQSLPAPRR